MPIIGLVTISIVKELQAMIGCATIATHSSIPPTLCKAKSLVTKHDKLIPASPEFN
jgi:hypothetical protein